MNSIQTESDHTLIVDRALRELTKDLVTTAERVIQQAGRLPEKSQFAKLAAVCSQAVCAEEIVNYIRYQAGRRTTWKPEFANQVLDAMSEPLEKLMSAMGSVDEGQRDRAKTEAWRRYAVYMSRSYTYESATKRRNDRNRRHTTSGANHGRRS